MTIEQMIERSASRYFAMAFQNLVRMRESLAEQGFDDDEIGTAVSISIDTAIADWQQQLPSFERWLRDCQAWPNGTSVERATEVAGAPASETVH